MENSKATGLLFSDILAVAFIVLKLCHVINWPWIWVLSPLWISFALYIFFVIVFVILSKVV